MARLPPILLAIAVVAAASGPAFADRADSLLAESGAAERDGRHDQAVRLAQSAIVADPTRASSYSALGNLYLGADQTDFARFYFGEALAIDPQDPAAQAGLAHADLADRSGPSAAARSLDKDQTGN